MISVFVECDSQIAEELSDWCDFNLDGFMGYVTGHKFYFDGQTEAKAFKIVAEEWK